MQHHTLPVCCGDFVGALARAVAKNQSESVFSSKSSGSGGHDGSGGSTGVGPGRSGAPFAVVPEEESQQE